MWNDFVQDLKYGTRVLFRARGFATAAILTLAIGIGATTAIFSVVNAVLLQPVPFKDLDRLTMVWQTDRNTGTNREPSSRLSLRYPLSSSGRPVGAIAPAGDATRSRKRVIRIARTSATGALSPMRSHGAAKARGSPAITAISRTGWSGERRYTAPE